AGHLWALAHACRAEAAGSLRHDEIFTGVGDVLALITEAATSMQDSHRTETVTGRQLQEAIADLKQSLPRDPLIDASWRDILSRLEAKATTIVDIARALSMSNRNEPQSMKSEVLIYSELL